jgi:glutathione S-transferase
MPSYRVTYFNGRGRAELTRLVLTAAGAEFEDRRITDWPNGKDGSSLKVGRLKKFEFIFFVFFLEAPLGQLPYLTVDGVNIPQSISMARYVARRHNLAGQDELSQTQADVVVDTLNDLQTAYYTKVYMVKTDEALQKFLAEDALTHLGRVEKIVALYGTQGFAVGSSLTWADLSVWDITSILVGIKSDILAAYPRISAIRQTVESHERIAQYLKSRPETPF